MIGIVLIAVVIYTIAVGTTLWKVAGADWRPDGRDGPSCIIHFGRCASAHEASNNWFALVQNHFDEDAGSVLLDHSGIDCGDTVRLSNLRGKHSMYNQCAGTVIRTWMDDDGKLVKALVSLNATHKWHEFYADSLVKVSTTEPAEQDESIEAPPA